jgi:TrmH family RNA methyltransferase
MLDQFIVVLHRPRDVRNLGAVVRAMKNLGFSRLRLVDPAPFDPADLLGIAHRAEDLVAAIERFESLPAALADARFVVGTSERPRADRPSRGDLRPLAAELVARARTAGPIALLFGPEDNGLDLAALDRCNLVLSIPADPAYPSLNLAQAALLLLHELRSAAVPPPLTQPRRPPATAGELEALGAALEAAIDAVGFVKSGDGAATMRRMRAVLARAEPDSSEAALLTAFAREVVYALRRARGDA